MNKKLLIVASMLATMGARAQFTPQGVAITTPNWNVTPYSTCGGPYRAGALWADGTGGPTIPQFLDFTQCFTLSFQEQFTNQSLGADGFAVVFGSNLTPTTAPNNTDAALGYYNRCSGPVNPLYNNSIGIEFDIFDNSYAPCTGDIPGIDHTEIAYNGCYDPVCTGPGGPSVPILPTSGFTSIKDGIFHNYTINWNCSTQLLSVLVDGYLRCQGPITPASFSPLTAVQWGFTGGTGAYCSDMIFQNVSVVQSSCIAASTISGPTDMCVGNNVTLTDPTPGGNWAVLSGPGVITAGGVLTGTAPGIITVTYGATGSACVAYYTVTVHEPLLTLASTPPIFPGPPATIVECGGATITASTIDLATGLPYSGSCSYVWTPTTGLTPPSGTSPVEFANPAVATSYAINVTDPYGCQASTTVDVIPSNNSCVCAIAACGAPIGPFPYSVISSPTSLGPNNYELTTSLTITAGNTLVLNNCVIVIDAGMSIVVQPGAKLVLNGCHLYCCGSMWKGITLQGGAPGSGLQGQILVNSSLIEDAMIAINVPSPQTPSGYTPMIGAPLIIQTWDAVFNKNNVAINIVKYNDNITPYLDPVPVIGYPTINYPDNPTCEYPFVIENTVFTSRDFSNFNLSPLPLCMSGYPLVWPNAMLLKAPWTPPSSYSPPYNIDNPYAYPLGGFPYISCNTAGVYAEYGIELQNVGTQIGGLGGQFTGMVIGGVPTSSANMEQNMFDDLEYGVYASNSNVIVRNSDFQHAQQNPTSGYGGDGIFAINNSGLQYQMWVYGSNGSLNFGQGGPTPLQSQFYDCINDIETHEYYNVNTEFALMMSNHSSAAMANPYGSNGIFLQSSYYGDIQLNYNTIENIATGINVQATMPAFTHHLYGQITANGNNLSSTNTSAPPTINEYMTQAIDINSSAGGYATTSISGCQINANDNQIGYVLNGIQISNFINQLTATADNNTVSLLQDVITGMASSYAQTGISLKGCDLVGYVVFNNVSGPGLAVPSPQSYIPAPYGYPVIEAYHVENEALSTEIGCNQASNINTGFYLSNGYMQWMNNSMTAAAYGVAVDGLIGPQIGPTTACNNNWLGGTWTGLNYATYVIGSTNPASSPIYVTSSGVPPTDGSDVVSNEYGTVPSSLYVISPSGIPCTQPPASSVLFRKADSNAVTQQNPNALQSYSLFPNPTNGNITLRQVIVDDKPVMGEIWNSIGQSVYKGAFNFAGGETLLNFANNTPGLYHIQLVDNSGQRYSLEFILK